MFERLDEELNVGHRGTDNFYDTNNENIYATSIESFRTCQPSTIPIGWSGGETDVDYIHVSM